MAFVENFGLLGCRAEVLPFQLFTDVSQGSSRVLVGLCSHIQVQALPGGFDGATRDASEAIVGFAINHLLKDIVGILCRFKGLDVAGKVLGHKKQPWQELVLVRLEALFIGLLVLREQDVAGVQEQGSIWPPFKKFIYDLCSKGPLRLPRGRIIIKIQDMGFDAPIGSEAGEFLAFPLVAGAHARGFIAAVLGDTIAPLVDLAVQGALRLLRLGRLRLLAALGSRSGSLHLRRHA